MNDWRANITRKLNAQQDSLIKYIAAYLYNEDNYYDTY